MTTQQLVERLGRRAYEIRFKGRRKGDVLAWEELPPYARAVWIEIGTGVALLAIDEARSWGGIEGVRSEINKGERK